MVRCRRDGDIPASPRSRGYCDWTDPRRIDLRRRLHTRTSGRAREGGRTGQASRGDTVARASGKHGLKWPEVREGTADQGHLLRGQGVRNHVPPPATARARATRIGAAVACRPSHGEAPASAVRGDHHSPVGTTPATPTSGGTSTSPVADDPGSDGHRTHGHGPQLGILAGPSLSAVEAPGHGFRRAGGSARALHPAHSSGQRRRGEVAQIALDRHSTPPPGCLPAGHRSSCAVVSRRVPRCAPVTRR